MSKGGKKVTPVFKNGEANGFSFTGAGNGGDRVTLVDDTGQEITISGGSSGTETDPIWTADKMNYYTKTETEALIPDVSAFLIPETSSNTLSAVDLTTGATVFTHIVQTAGIYHLTGTLNSTVANVSINFDLQSNSTTIASVVYDSGVQNTSQVYGSNLHEFAVGDVITVTATSPTTVTGHIKMIKVDKPSVAIK